MSWATFTAENRRIGKLVETVAARDRTIAELRERIAELEAELNVVRVSTRFGIPLDCAAESRLIDARIEAMKGDTP